MRMRALKTYPWWCEDIILEKSWKAKAKVVAR
jgi:hypothetical protein